MKRLVYYLPILLIMSNLPVSGQERYSTEKAYFSTDGYDEFSPVIFGDRIVFCSNKEDEQFITYVGRDNNGLFNIFSVPVIDSLGRSTLEIFSRNLMTPFNDGPVTFDPTSTQIAYSRNIDIKAKAKNIFDLSNNLGIYFAELSDGQWTNIKAFEFNDSLYSNTTPWISPDGKYLYFASNMPGGLGGSDLYRSEYKEGRWAEPENLGDIINTKGNEVYPFVSTIGDLFFASDGHPGLGKKDLFLSRETENGWMEPVHLGTPINSKEDDFGLITNGEFESGYFSSNRLRSDDIFMFKTVVPQLFDCDTLQENQYCFTFWDEKYPGVDSLPVIYEWEFSDGNILRGLEVEHCFAGAGSYWARLNIVDNSTSNTFFTQSSMEFVLTDIEQPYISSRDAFINKQEMEFSGSASNMPDLKIEGYIWDFGDNEFDTGIDVKHIYYKAGIYNVKLGLTGYYEGSEVLKTFCIIKPVTILSDNQALATFMNRTIGMIPDELKPTQAETDRTRFDYSVHEIDPEAEVFRVEVISSTDKLSLEDTIFNPLRRNYDIKEYYVRNDSLYSYAVGEATSLLETYPIYTDVVEKGYNTASVKTYVLAELPVAVIEKINREFADMADANFEFNEFEVSEKSYPVLDRVANIMMNNPDLKMEIAAHTDNMGAFEYNMMLSTRRAESIVAYLVSKGVSKDRLVAKGYGESRAIATNNTEEGRMRNRRVEFLILNMNN